MTEFFFLASETTPLSFSNFFTCSPNRSTSPDARRTPEPSGAAAPSSRGEWSAPLTVTPFLPSTASSQAAEGGTQRMMACVRERLRESPVLVG